MQWIPSEKKEQSDALFDGQVTEVYLIDGHALPPSAIHEALARPEQEPDDLTIAYMTGFHAGKNTPQPKPEQEFFVVKHYSADERPTIKGNGFDGLEVGTDREDAEEFIKWVNARISTPPKREWVGLTGPEVVEAYRSVSEKEWAIGGLADARVFFCAIEAKLKEKNGC
jgi:hypothetical protein